MGKTAEKGRSGKARQGDGWARTPCTSPFGDADGNAADAPRYAVFPLYFSFRTNYNTSMVKLRVVAVGGIKESFYREAIAEYVKRLGKWAKVEILEAEEASRIDDPTAKAGAEADGILRRLKGRTVLLDVKGRRITSEGIADLLKRYVNAGDSEITFVIGGSNGVAQAVKDRADEVISFGDITLPHQLFRVVLLEQLYRAETILHNAAYHK